MTISPVAIFVDDGRARLSNNAAERALRGVALGRKAWLFAIRAAACFQFFLLSVLRLFVSLRVPAGASR